MTQTDNNSVAPVKLTREEHALLVKVQVDPVRAILRIVGSIHEHRRMAYLELTGFVAWHHYRRPHLTAKGIAQLEHPPEPDADPDP